MYFKLGKCIKHEQRSEKLVATCGRISHMNTCDRSSFGKRLCDRHVRWEDFNCFGSLYKYFTLCNNFLCKCVRHVTRSLTSFNMLGPAVPSDDQKTKRTDCEGRSAEEDGSVARRRLSPCLMPLNCTFVAWTPTRLLFVLCRWGSAECNRALTPEAAGIALL